MNEEEFDCMGTTIDFNPLGDNPEDEVTGIAYTYQEIEVIKREFIRVRKTKEEVRE